MPLPGDINEGDCQEVGAPYRYGMCILRRTRNPSFTTLPSMSPQAGHARGLRRSHYRGPIGLGSPALIGGHISSDRSCYSCLLTRKMVVHFPDTPMLTTFNSEMEWIGGMRFVLRFMLFCGVADRRTIVDTPPPTHTHTQPKLVYVPHRKKVSATKHFSEVDMAYFNLFYCIHSKNTYISPIPRAGRCMYSPCTLLDIYRPLEEKSIHILPNIPFSGGTVFFTQQNKLTSICQPNTFPFTALEMLRHGNAVH